MGDEYILPKTIAASSKTNKKLPRNKFRGRKNKFNHRHHNNQEEDELFEDEINENDADREQQQQIDTSRGCSKYQKNVLILLFVLVGFGALFLTQMDRIVIAFGQIGDSASGLLSNKSSSHHVGVDSVVEKPAAKQDFHGRVHRRSVVSTTLPIPVVRRPHRKVKVSRTLILQSRYRPSDKRRRR